MSEWICRGLAVVLRRAGTTGQALCVLSLLAYGDSAFGQKLNEAATLGGHRKPVQALAFSPDGKVLASGSSGVGRGNEAGDLIVYNYKNEILYRKSVNAGVYSLAISPDGKTLATGALDGTVTLWNTADGERRGAIRCPDGVFSLDFSTDGSTLVTGSVFTGIARAWDTALRKPKWMHRFHERENVHIGVSSNLNLFALAAGKTVVLLDPPMGRARAVLDHAALVSSLALSQDGKLLAAGSLDERFPIKIWDLSRRVVRLKLPLNSAALAFFADGRRLASDIGTDLWVWDLSNGQGLFLLNGHRPRGPSRSGGFIGSVAVAPDGRALAAGYPDGTVVLWDLKSRAGNAVKNR